MGAADETLECWRMMGHAEAPPVWMLELPSEIPLNSVPAVSDEEWQRALAFGALLAVLQDVPATQLKAAIRREML